MMEAASENQWPVERSIPVVSCLVESHVIFWVLSNTSCIIHIFCEENLLLWGGLTINIIENGVGSPGLMPQVALYWLM